MNKVILLLLALALAPWARTWEDAKNFYGIVWFDGDTLGDEWNRSNNPDWGGVRYGLYFWGMYDGIDSMGTYIRYNLLSIKNDSLSIVDSVWISKYYMDDSLRDEPVEMSAEVNRDDFRLLTFDSLQTEYVIWYKGGADDRAEKKSDRNSLYILYKKDTSYYALCLLGYISGNCTNYLSCVFQDDGTTDFEKLPDSDDIDEILCPTSLPGQPPRAPARLRESFPYQINGTQATGNASSVIIDGNRPKVQLRK